MSDLPASDSWTNRTRPVSINPHPAFHPTRTRTGSVAAPAADYPRVPGYRIEGRLGRGGMGVVYRAVQTTLNRPVALKMLGGDHAAVDADGRHRFRKEAEALASLRHPNVVPVYEVGEADGVPYFSMELVDGGTLADRLLRQPPTPAEAAALTAQLARGVHAAHEAGILHRDLKPSNVLLSGMRPNDWLTPKVADFGIAKRFGAARGDDRTMTQAGDLLGTPAYMAPEQADAGSRVRVGPAADIYSLGAVLYELLTRRPPFDAGDPVRTLMEVLNQDPTPPTKFVPAVPRDLEIICLKCLQKDPRKRYATAAALADDLDRYLAGQPITARPVSATERACKWARRRPGTAALLGITALTIVAAFAAVTWAWKRADDRAYDEAVARELAVEYGEREAAARELADERGRELERHALEAEYGSIRAYVEAGMAACRSDEVPRGLVLLTRAIEKASALRPRFPEPARLDRLDYVARANLAAWDAKLVLRTRARFHVVRAKHVWIVDVDLSADGTRVLTANMDGVLRLLDAVTARDVGAPVRFDGPVFGATFSPDGKRFLVVRQDDARPGLLARVWDTTAFEPTGPEVPLATVTTGELMFWTAAWLPDGQVALQTGPNTVSISRTISPTSPAITLEADMPVTAFAPIGDGSTVVTGHVDGTLRRWDAASGRETARTTATDDAAFGVVVSPDGRQLFSAHWPGRLRLFAADTLAAGPVIRTPGALRAAADPRVHGFVRTADYSPDGRTILAGGGTVTAPRKIDGYLQTYDATDGRPLVAFPHPEPVWGAAFAGDRVVSACEDKTVRVFRMTDGAELAVVRQSGNPGKVVVGKDGRTILAGDLGGTPAALLADLGPNDQPHPPLRFKGQVRGLAFTPNGDRVWVVGPTGPVSAVDPRTGTAEPVVVLPGKDPKGIVLDAAGGRVFTYLPHWEKPPQRLEGWATGAGKAAWIVDPGALTDLVLLRDGGLVTCPVNHGPVVCLNRDVTVRWKTLDYKPGSSPYTFAAALADGRAAVGGQGARAVSLLDAATGKAFTPVAVPGRVNGLEAHPTANRILVTYLEGFCQEVDLTTGKPTGASIALRGTASFPRYAPDGASVAVVQNDANRFQVERYDLATGLPLGPPLPAAAPIQRIAFDPIGRRLAVADEEGEVRFWNLPAPMTGPPDRLTCWAEMVGRLELMSGPYEVVRFLDDQEVGDRRRRLQAMAAAAGERSR